MESEIETLLSSRVSAELEGMKTVQTMSFRCKSILLEKNNNSSLTYMVFENHIQLNK